MKTYQVGLTRIYLVTIKAEDEYQAKMYSEYFLGHCEDLSTEKEQQERNFSIEESEMVYNDAHEIVSVTD